jgi:signal transduction histidine kinase
MSRIGLGESASTIDATFPGNTEMARRMREFDWSTTSLGPVEQWPQALRTAVSISLNCAFPIVLWWGPDLTLLYNDEYRAILGPAKHPAALGKPGEAVWAEIWDIVGPMLRQVVSRGEATRSRDLMLHINRGYSEEAYFSFSYSPIFDEGNVGGIFCPVIETTERVIGERRLRTLRDLAASCKGAESESAAYESAAKVLAENSCDVPFALIYRVDDDASIASLRATAGIEPGLAASPRTVAIEAERPVSWPLKRVSQSGKTSVVTEFPDAVGALPTGAWKVAPESVVVLPVLLPGQERPRAILVAAASPMRALEKDYRTFFELIATQIASGLADAQAREEEHRRAEALAAIDRAKTAFFSNVSHEFRTPLTLMLGPLEDVLGDPTLRPDYRRSVELAHRNGIRLLKLVNTLLDFSRIEAGRVEAVYQATDIAALTAELSSNFRSACERAGIALVIDCPTMPAPVYVDRDMWEKIVLNLLSNAFKHTFDGEITVTLDWNERAIQLIVRDTGTGIPADEIPHLFERFYRVRTARGRTQEGTGIGLALVRELTTLHGGSVGAASIPGSGSTFTVTIPRGKDHLPPEQIGRSRSLPSTALGAVPYVEEALRWLPGGEPAPSIGLGEGVGTSSPLHQRDTGSAFGPVARRRIVWADDNADMREYVSHLLGPEYDVEAVPDGEAALAAVRRQRPDLVLSDIMMPKMDGFGLLHELRAAPETRTVPVILLSARAGEESRIEGLEQGADDYLVKPFSARELLARVAARIEVGRLQNQVAHERQELAAVAADREALLARERTARLQADAASRLKDEFLAVLSHELRTPLNSILLWSNEVRRDPKASVERINHALDVIERSARVQARLTEDLLDLSSIISGKLRLNATDANLAEVVSAAVDAVRPDARARRLEVELRGPSRLTARVDAGRIQQVVWNLVSNAVKFTPPGGGSIKVHLQQVASNAAIRVKDSGHGISAEFLPHVFERFTQADSSTSRQYGGLGLGLALAREIVDAHGGSVHVESPGVGQGATFTILLPILEEPAGKRLPAPGAHQPQHGARATHLLSKVTVLVVDDDVDTRELLAVTLGRYGAVVTAVESARQALAAIRRQRPQVLLADIGMPGVDGFALIQKVRTGGSKGRPRIPAIALTAYAGALDRQRAIAAGFDSHLTKPVEPEALVRAILNVLTA